jgi:hypothetical protein
MSRKLYIISIIVISALAVILPSANANDTITACINPSGLIHIVLDGDGCGNNETAVELQAVGAPVDCPCYTAEELAAITATECSTYSWTTSGFLILDDSGANGVTVASVYPEYGLECYYYNPNANPTIDRRIFGLYENESRACRQLLEDRANELNLVCTHH